MKARHLFAAALLVLVSLASSRLFRTEAVGVSTLPYVVATVSVGSTPRGIGVDEARNLIYVSSQLELVNKLVKIDGATLGVSNFSPAVSLPIGVAVNSAANRVLVANSDQTVMSVLNGEDGTLVSTPTIGSGSHGVAFNASTGKAYVVSYNDNALYRVNTANDDSKAIALTGKPVWVALNPGLKRAYVTLVERQAIAVIDTDTDQQIGEFGGFYGDVVGIAVNPSTGDIYAANMSYGSVSVVDASGTPKGWLDVGSPSGRAMGVAVNPNTGHVFVTRYDNDKVYVFDGTGISGGGSVSAIAEITVGDGPEFGIAVHTATNRVYVANYNAGTVSVISDLPKTIQLSTSSLLFYSEHNGTAPTQSITINNPGSGTLDWTATISYTDGSGWLTADPPAGATTPATVTVGINTAPGSPLAAGTYRARLNFASPGAANTPQSVDISLVIYPQNSIQLSTNNIVFLTRPSSTASTQSITINNPGTGTLSWTRTVSYTDGSSGWLMANPTLGTGTPATVNVDINSMPGGIPLVEGTYRGRLIFDASGAVNTPQSVDVALVIKDDITKTYLPVVARSFSGGW